jgi:hypothetical protein
MDVDMVDGLLALFAKTTPIDKVKIPPSMPKLTDS